MAEDLEAQLSGMSAKELKKYADEKGIDVGGAKQKKKLIEAILAASPKGEPAVPADEPAKEAEAPAQEPRAEPAKDVQAPEPQAEPEKPAEPEKAPEPAEPAFDEAEFEKSLQGINTELEQIGTHIVSTLGKLAGIDEITADELRTIDESIISTTFVEVDFDEPRSRLRDAKALHDRQDWRKAFKASSDAIQTMERQAKGFRRVAYARALEACERSLSGLDRGTEGLATAQHELLHAKLLFSRDDEKRLLESLSRLDAAVASLPDVSSKPVVIAPQPAVQASSPGAAPEAAPQADATVAAEPQPAQAEVQHEVPASARRGRCSHCHSTDIVFSEDGTARCRGCGRMFVWRKSQKKGFFDRMFGSK